ncbi:MAG: winged helix-turn-helix transcriptional regulator [Spirochaetales bacterium]|nr:winged helix-turn-helix transcriptional regulator [Spirochaetales bacterium]
MTNDNDFTLQEIISLTDHEQIKAYVHPTRIKILNLLAEKKRTVSGIARELGVHPANITHHIKLLEKTGLIQLVEKRDIGKNIEKYYRAIARNFIVNSKGDSMANKKALALSVLKNDLAVAINTVNEDETREVMALLETARLSKGDVKKIMNQLKMMIKDFSKSDTKDGIAYNLNISLYPHEVQHITNTQIIIQ